jgi:RNA polymerase sigma-70 factor, ECF subfamily
MTDVRTTDATTSALDDFQRERRRLFGIAYRMLGSVREAEDVLQDAYVRWHRVDHAAVENPSAYLVRMVTRLCMDALKSARSRRLEYVGPWLPEPLVEDRVDELALDAVALQERADDLSMAFLLMLERLTPVERAVFLLRESFGFGYAEIAEVVGRSEPNCRQIERRARQRLADEERGRPVDAGEHDRLLRRFLEATRDGDVDGLLQLLTADVVTWSDGGGKATAARRPVTGPLNVARFWTGLASKVPPGFEFRIGRVNGRAGLLSYHHGRLFHVVTIDADERGIRGVYVVLNPDKLPQDPAPDKPV